MKTAREKLGMLVFTAALVGACQGMPPTNTTTAALTSVGSIVPTQETTPGSKTTIGPTPGDFAVTDDGQASYRIPIWTPAGVMGIEPSLALSYNSGQGAGPLGVGWTLTGMPISQIVRCAPSIALDGDSGPVDFDGSTYCMDGKRLVWIGGTEFRTERDEFAKIVAGGSIKYPTGFTVYLHNGRVLTYGSSASSRMTGKQIKWTANEWNNNFPAPTVQTTGTYAWGLDTVSDRAGALANGMRGNLMTVSYLSESHTTPRYPAPITFAEFLPQQIDYSFGRSGTTGHRSVKFTYTATRPDPRYSFVSGFGMSATKRLERIDVSGPNPITTGLLRSYEIAYDAGPVTHRARLKSVTECDGAHICKAPTRFEWDDGSNQYSDLRDEYWFDPTADDSPLYVLDIDGDGIDDIAYRRRGLWVYRLGTLKTDTAPLSLTEGSLPFDQAGTGGVQALDVDRDGRTDFAAAALRDFAWDPFVFHEQDWNYFRSTRSSSGVDFSQLTVPTRTPLELSSSAHTPLFVADLDGDGLPETLQPDAASLGRFEQPAGSLHYVAVVNKSWDFRRNLGSGSMGYITHVSGPGMPWYATGDGWNSYVAGVDGTSRQALLFGGSDLVFPLNAIAPIHPSFRYHAALMTHAGDSKTFDTTLLAGDSRLIYGIHYIMLDVNGDGLMDALRVENGDGVAPETAEKLEINTGLTTQGVGFADVSGSRMVVRAVPSAEFQGNMAYLFNGETDPGIRVADMNQDGISDVVLMGRAEPNNGRGHRDFVNVLQGATAPSDSDTLSGGAVPTLYPSGETLPTAAKLYNNYSFAQLGDFNGDGLTDIALRPEKDPNHLHIYIHQGNKADQITKVTDGNGSEIKIGYRPISDANVYTPAVSDPNDANAECRYPIYCLKRGMWVVSYYFISDDNALKGHYDNFQLKYEDGHTHATRGWFGFRRRVLHDGNTGADMVTEYNNDTYFTAHLPAKDGSIVREDSGTLHRSVTIYQYQLRPRSKTPNIFSVPIRQINFDEEVLKLSINGSLDGVIFDSAQPHQTVRSTTTTFDYDDLGNLKDRTMVTPRGEKYEMVSHFDNDPMYDTIGAPGGPLIGVLRETDESSTARSGEVQQRTTFYEPYPKTHLSKNVTVEPNGDDSVRSVTKYVRDPVGLGQPTQSIVTTTATADEPAIQKGTKVTRKSSFTYDDVDGVYPAKVTNNLNQPTSFAYHGGLGVLAAEQDANGVVTSFQYDGFGRPRVIHPPGAADITTSYELPPAPPAALGAAWRSITPAYAIHTQRTGGAEGIVTYDLNGKEVLRQERGFDGQYSYTFRSYTKIKGQVAAVTRPFRDGDTPFITQFAYDNLGRPSTTLLPDQYTITHTYTPRVGLGVVVHTKEPSGALHDTNYDDFGRVVGNTTGGGELPGATTFEYGPFSVLRQVNPPVVANSSQQTRTVLTMIYDALGRRTELYDADAGHQARRYNAFGEVIKETDANNDVVQYNRDELGRVRWRSAYADNAYFDWDTAPNGIGKLADSSSGDYIYKTFTYDTAGRPATTSWMVGGHTYVLSQGYDSSGRVNEIDYPTVGTQQLRVGFDFDAVGQVNGVHALAPGSTQYWNGISRTADNRMEWENTGTYVFTNRAYDGKRGWLTQIATDDDFKTRQLLTYDHDPDGNVIGRHDMLNHTDETFTYDGFSNRQLEAWSFHSEDGGQWTVGFYPGQDGSLAGRDGTGPNASSTWYDYVNGAGAAAHGVTTVNGQTQFAYDAKGNQTQRWGWNVSYNSSGQPTRMNLPDYSQYWDFAYDGDQQRTLKTGNYYGNVQQTIYIGGLYERRTDVYGTITHVFYIPGADRLVAQETWTEDTLGNLSPQEVMYLHDDILGSIETTSSQSGYQDASYKYDPFGARIYPTDPTYPGWSLPQLTLGYTGHQMDDDLGLIHMRGRTYDPHLARFLTPDPMVTEPFSTLSYDRYAYVMNNPMGYTDPSGFDRITPIPATDTTPPMVDVVSDDGTRHDLYVLDPPAPQPDGSGYPAERADNDPSGNAAASGRAEVDRGENAGGAGFEHPGGGMGGPCPGCVVPFDFGQPELHADESHEHDERGEIFQELVEKYGERGSQAGHVLAVLAETGAHYAEHNAPQVWKYPNLWPHPWSPLVKDPKWLGTAKNLEKVGRFGNIVAIGLSTADLAVAAHKDGLGSDEAMEKGGDVIITSLSVAAGPPGVILLIEAEAAKEGGRALGEFSADVNFSMTSTLTGPWPY